MASAAMVRSRTGHAGWRCIAVAWASLGAWFLPVPTVAVATEAESVADVNEAVRIVGRAVEREPSMEGGWLHLDAAGRGHEGRVVVRRILDVDRQADQSRTMDRILASALPAGSYAIDTPHDARVPYGRLKAEMQSRLIDDPRFEGCRFLGAAYRENVDDGSLELVPRLEVLKEAQFEEFIGQWRRAMNGDPVWAKARISVADNAEGQYLILPEPLGPDLNALDRQVRNAIRDVPALRGSWLEVDRKSVDAGGIGPDYYEFTRTFDASRVAGQSDAMDAFIRRAVPNGRHRIIASKDRHLPLSDLLAEIRQATDVEPSLAGCSVASAYYVQNPDDGTHSLVLEGRLWKPHQESLLQDLCRRRMAENPVWQEARVGVLDTERGALAIVPPNLASASAYYSEAMHRFWHHDYIGANQWLALASLEDPANVVYRYWRVLCELALGDQTLAELRLERTVSGFRVSPLSDDHVRVLRSIYRVQGPLRQALMAAERKVMVNRSLGASTMSRQQAGVN
jgi:hypothetical protein